MQTPTDVPASNAETSKLFSGKQPVIAALKQLRLRLLDLTSRNRLLNFKTSGEKILQVVGASPNTVYASLLDGQSFQFDPVPDPPISEYLGPNHRQKPDVREYAKKLGIPTSYDLREDTKAEGANGDRRLQVILYPNDLERRCRRIAHEARSAIEETGINMLYLIVGFLEFYESDESERPLNAPLIAVPAVLKRSTIDPETRMYRYELTYSGEEVEENLCLREKLSQEFQIQLPTLDTDAEPEAHFRDVERAVSRRARWRVKRHITLAMLSFAKMVLLKDLQIEKWNYRIGFSQANGLLSHPIIKTIFEGG